MCNYLHIKFWPLACRNNKGNIVEDYHRFLNKTQVIVGQYCGSHDLFIQNAKTSQYACNSAQINNTDVICSVADVGIEFIFPLDIELLPTQTMNPDNNKVLFTISVLNIIIE